VGFASHGDVRIHYRVEGTGRPLVLLHGFGGSSEQFYFMGWVAALRDHYRLILMDARGHGMSDKPHEPEAYRMEMRVGDVTAVLDDLGIRQAHCLGYSDGGEVGFGIAKYAPERVTSLIIGGADAEDPDPDHPSAWSEQMMGLLRSGLGAVVSGFRERAEQEIQSSQRPSVLEAMLPHRLQLISECDPEALIALLSFRQKECLRLAETLPHLTIPCLLFVGEADASFEGAKAASALIPHARFVSFPGLAHIETGARVDLVLPPILSFLSEVDSGLKA
jgi:pimeloyl-ACP methyl ester carboxylesterase